MKRLAFSMFFICFFYSIFASPIQNDSTAKIIKNLNTIESMYFKYLTKQEQKEAISLINEVRSIIAGIDIPVNNASNPNVLNEEGFLSLYTSVKNEIGDSNKTKIILSIGRNGRITCSQLEKIIALYSFDHYRSELLMAIADNILDPVNIGVVAKHYDSSIDRDEIIKYFQTK